MYFVHTPYIIKKLFSSIIWDLPNGENKIYLTFDDGPHPEITPWILEQLRKYDAKASFFCLGKNAEKYPEIITQILNDGHTIGNHGFEHLNGWKTNDEDYFEDIKKSRIVIEKLVQDFNKTSLFPRNDKVVFRPAYGKIKKSQILNLKSQTKIVNWSLMPGDFDTTISSEKCYQHLIKNIKTGDIVVLHDSEKSRKHLEYCLPKWLEFIYDKGLKSDSISLQP